MRMPIPQAALAGLALMLALTASPAAAVTYASTVTLNFGGIKFGVVGLTPSQVNIALDNMIYATPIDLSVDLEPGASATLTLGLLRWERFSVTGSTGGFFGLGIATSGGAFPSFSANPQTVIFENFPQSPRLLNLPVSIFDISPILPPGLTLTSLQWRPAAGSPTSSQYSAGLGWRPTPDGAGRIFEGLELVGDFHAAGTAGAIPEPATWALLIGGFALTGVALRRRQPISV
jgi:hypothetical protein